LELNPKDLTPLKGHRFKVLGTGVQAAVRIQSMLGPTSGPTSGPTLGPILGPTLGPTLLVEAENAASKFGDTPNSGVVLKHVTLSKRVPSMNASQFATELLHPTSHVAKGAVEGTKEPDQPPPGVPTTPTTPTTSSLYVEISLNRAVTLPSHITTHGHYSPLFSFLSFLNGVGVQANVVAEHGHGAFPTPRRTFRRATLCGVVVPNGHEHSAVASRSAFEQSKMLWVVVYASVVGTWHIFTCNTTLLLFSAGVANGGGAGTALPERFRHQLPLLFDCV